MGSVLNMKPDISCVAIAGVPFVDVINTMMDPSIPLTINEYEEWGNPNELHVFKYMAEYSPYENIKPGVQVILYSLIYISRKLTFNSIESIQIYS